MVTPSAPTLGSVQFEFAYPLCRDPQRELLRTEEEKHELCDATDELLAGIGYLRKVEINFCNGSVLLTVEAQQNPEFSGTLLLDIMATKFFKDNKNYIGNLNPALFDYIEGNILTKDIRKISDIFYRTFNQYLEEYTDENGLDTNVEGSTIACSKPGFKNFDIDRDHWNQQVTSFNILKEKAGDKFKKFLQTIPSSLLTQKDTKKAALFLQEGLNQKNTYSDKLMYLRQVLFLLTFQDVFKEGLYELKQSLNIERDNLYRSPSRSHDISQDIQHIHRRIELIDKTLSKLPINDVLTLIPLACRSSIQELSQDAFLERYSVKEDSLSRECDKGRQADIAIRNVLENSFHVNPKSFAVKGEHSVDNTTGIESIESYLMGLSGLAISPGLMGRLAMNDHYTIYYKRSSSIHIPSVSDNFPMEFLLTAAQFCPSNNENWIEETCLGYVTEMMGVISPHELDGIKYKIQRVRDAVNKAPVDTLLKQENTLRNSAIPKLQSLYKQTRKEVGLAPLPDKSSCCVM